MTKPPAGPYEADAYFDGKCVFQADPISWELRCPTGTTTKSGTSRIIPKTRSHRAEAPRRAGYIKLQILSYYKGSTSANYSLTWSYLP